MAMGHFFDGHITGLVGTHTHVPTSDTRILDKGTAYQTDLGMCGDYNSVIGFNKETHSKDFLKKDAVKHFPSEGDGTLSGIVVEADKETGLAKKVSRLIIGGNLKISYGRSFTLGRNKHKKEEQIKRDQKYFLNYQEK